MASHAGDLAFKYLYFGHASRDCHIDCPSDAFDKIGASIVLPYLYDPDSVVRELYRLLAPGGVIVLSSPKPNFDSSKSYIELAAFVQHVLDMADEGRFRFYNASDLTNLLSQAGFINMRTVEALGSPPTALIVRAEKAV
jgi:SAM-dependent methyltransferase